MTLLASCDTLLTAQKNRKRGEQKCYSGQPQARYLMTWTLTRFLIKSYLKSQTKRIKTILRIVKSTKIALSLNKKKEVNIMSRVSKIFKIYKAKNLNCRLFTANKQFIIKKEMPTLETKKRYTEKLFRNSYTLLCYLERSI